AAVVLDAVDLQEEAAALRNVADARGPQMDFLDHDGDGDLGAGVADLHAASRGRARDVQPGLARRAGGGLRRRVTAPAEGRRAAGAVGEASARAPAGQLTPVGGWGVDQGRLVHPVMK